MNRIFLYSLLMASLLMGAARADEIKRTRVGWVEKVGLDDSDIFVKARMDTGAGMASVNAEIIKVKKPEKAGGLERVVYKISDGSGKSKTLESDILEWKNIKKKGADGFSKRPVVKMGICIGNKKIIGRVNLSERKNFLYPVLIGRNLLKTGKFLVDPLDTFTHKPTCKSNSSHD